MNYKNLCLCLLVICTLSACGKRNSPGSAAYHNDIDISFDKVEEPFKYFKRVQGELPRYSCKKLRKEIDYSGKVSVKSARYIAAYSGKPNKEHGRIFDIGAMYTSVNNKLTEEHRKRC